MHILQNIHGENTHKIVRYQGQKVTQEIDHDEHGNVIFKGGPLYIAETAMETSMSLIPFLKP